MNKGIILLTIGGIMVTAPGLLLIVLVLRVLWIELGMSNLVPYAQGMVHGSLGLAVILFMFVGVPGLFIARAGMRSMREAEKQ